MNGLLLLGITSVILIGAYLLYGRYLVKSWGIDPNAKTPEQTLFQAANGKYLLISFHRLPVQVL